MKAIYPGSFDPLTYGHLDIISRASKICDKLFVVIAQNPNKEYLLSTEERLYCLREEVKQSNVECLVHKGLLVDCAAKLDTNILVRGIRDTVDINTELHFSRANKVVGDLETIWLPASFNTIALSSSLIRDIAQHHGDISLFVPDTAIDLINSKMIKPDNQSNKN